jgi:Ca2+-binding EF-hand superfamily protein
VARLQVIYHKVFDALLDFEPTDNKRKSLQGMLRKFDRHNSGLVTERRFKAYLYKCHIDLALTKQEMRWFIRDLDPDMTGLIDYGKFYERVGRFETDREKKKEEEEKKKVRLRAYSRVHEMRISEAVLCDLVSQKEEKDKEKKDGEEKKDKDKVRTTGMPQLLSILSGLLTLLGSQDKDKEKEKKPPSIDTIAPIFKRILDAINVSALKGRPFHTLFGLSDEMQVWLKPRKEAGADESANNWSWC